MSLLPILLFAAAQAQSPPPAPASEPAELREMLQDCGAYSFETVVSAVVEGKLRRTRMKMCGTKGQSDSGWLRTLEDSAAKIAANEGIAKPLREEMIKAIKGEIAHRSAPSGSPSVGSGGSKDFTLKPRMAAPGASTDNARAGYTSLPPLPPPVSVAEAAREDASKPYVPPPPIVRPDLGFGCFSTTSVGEAPCIDFDRFTTIVVLARSPLAAGSSLRFVRDGAERAQVALGTMKKGQRRRIPLPAELCQGVNGGSLKIETLVLPKAANAQPQLADTDGPYFLRC